MTDKAGYEGIADELYKRISELVPKHPEILKIENPFDLFNIEGFRCDDLQPSLLQVVWVLDKVKKETSHDIQQEEIK